MTFSIAPSIIAAYPDLTVGVLALHGIDNSGSHAEITGLLRKAEADVRMKIADPESLKTHPKIMAWQEAHRAFGSNPNKYPPSCQAVLKRVLRGGELPSINPLVDLYNLISIKYILNAGGEDLGKTVGDIVLTHAEGTEEFIELGGTLNDQPEKGEVIYRDARGVICRKFNWRESERAKLTEATKHAVLVLEGLPPSAPEEVEGALQELKGLVAQYCGGTSAMTMLSKHCTKVDLGGLNPLFQQQWTRDNAS